MGSDEGEIAVGQPAGVQRSTDGADRSEQRADIVCERLGARLLAAGDNRVPVLAGSPPRPVQVIGRVRNNYGAIDRDRRSQVQRRYK